MKKSLLFLIIIMSALNLHSAEITDTLRVQVAPGTRIYEGKLHWNYAVRDGEVERMTGEVDTLSVLGASDSLFSDVLYNLGDNNIKFILTGGTVNLQIRVQTTNSDVNIRTGNIVLSDTLFKDYYYIKTGSTPDSSMVDFNAYTFTAVGETHTIVVPLLGAQLYRYAIYSTASQSGNTKIEAFIRLKEE